MSASDVITFFFGLTASFLFGILVGISVCTLDTSRKA